MLPTGEKGRERAPDRDGVRSGLPPAGLGQLALPGLQGTEAEKPLFRGEKDYADRGRNIYGLISGRQVTGVRVDLQQNQLIGILVCRNEVLARGIDLEVTRVLA